MLYYSYNKEPPKPYSKYIRPLHYVFVWSLLSGVDLIGGVSGSGTIIRVSGLGVETFLTAVVTGSRVYGSAACIYSYQAP